MESFRNPPRTLLNAPTPWLSPNSAHSPSEGPALKLFDIRPPRGASLAVEFSDAGVPDKGVT